ncbi:MAG: hypothetical protein R3D58_13080 [Saprospiraceae bacterium]
MPNFSDHVNQSVNNLRFLEGINGHLPNYCDWQVTVCFYTALHLVNAYLANSGMQYRKHSEVTNAINPMNQLSPFSIPEDPYSAYISLMSLSRRSRYLALDTDLQSKKAHLTYDKHLAKAIRHLETIMQWFSGKFPDTSFPTINVKCIEIKAREGFRYFKKKN